MGILRAKFLVSTHLFLWISVALSIPPEDAIKCSAGTQNCTITNFMGSFPDRSLCKAGEAAYPATEQELIATVAQATKKTRKMKVATLYSHSIPKLVCPGGEDGLLISTRNLNKIVNVDRMAMRITVESGVTLKKLINEAAKAGLALPHSPYWSGLTVGGLLSTGAHGSSLWGKGSAVHEYIVEVRIVSPGTAEDGYVRVRSLNTSHQDLDAVKVSLGVLGVISQVTLQLVPMFKRSITYETKDDHDLADQVVSFGKLHEFADLFWFPNKRKVLYKIDDRVSSDVQGNGRLDLFAFRPTTSAILENMTTTEESLESTSDANGKCKLSELITSSIETTAFGLTNNGINFTGYPVVGFQNELQSTSSCLDDTEDETDRVCSWDPRVKGYFFYQMSLSIALSNAKDFFDDLKKLFSLIPESTCGIEMYNGFLVRYVKASSAYLGKQEDSIEFDISYYRSRDPMVPRLYEDTIEEVEQMAVFKYNALPHWGKNRNVAFEGVIKKYKKAGEFLKVMEKYDPLKLFSSEWTDQVLGLQGGLSIIREGCALEGLCVCSKDSQCAPERGYFCRPGRVYKEARVCTLIRFNKHTEL